MAFGLQLEIDLSRLLLHFDLAVFFEEFWFDCQLCGVPHVQRDVQVRAHSEREPRKLLLAKSFGGLIDALNAAQPLYDAVDATVLLLGYFTGQLDVE